MRRRVFPSSTGALHGRLLRLLLLFLLIAAGSLSAVEARKPRERRERRVDVRAELRFAAKMARQGLWREALFRWERAARARPDDGRIWNNIAVAREATGDRDGAREAYRKAIELSPSQEIAANQSLFLAREQRVAESEEDR